MIGFMVDVVLVLGAAVLFLADPAGGIILGHNAPIVAVFLEVPLVHSILADILSFLMSGNFRRERRSLCCIYFLHACHEHLSSPFTMQDIIRVRHLCNVASARHVN
jgi:hypothetical protein